MLRRGAEIMSEQKKGQTIEEKQYLVRFNADIKSHYRRKYLLIINKIVTIYAT